MSNINLERLKAEEAELEAQMLGDQTQDPENPVVREPSEAESPESAISTTDADGLVPTTEENEAGEFMENMITQPSHAEGFDTDEEQPDDQPQKRQYTDWKKRFKGLQRSHEATVHAHKTEVMELRETIDDLKQQLADLRDAKQEVQGDVFDGIFSEEDEDTFGTEGLDIVKKAARAAIEKQVKPLQEELRRQERARLEESKKSTQASRQSAYQDFLKRLESLVPEYAELNVDKDFLAWMSLPDEFSGYPRGQLFQKAEANGDVLRVADFFLQYKEETAPKPKTVDKDIERQVTPVGSGGGGSSSPKPKREATYYRESDINKFYDDVLKGRYKGRHDTVLATEAAIDQAMAEGRILRGQ